MPISYATHTTTQKKAKRTAHSGAQAQKKSACASRAAPRRAGPGKQKGHEPEARGVASRKGEDSRPPPASGVPLLDADP